MGARGLGGDVEAEPVVAPSVARRAGGVVSEEALAAAFEGGGRKARSVVGNLDDEAPARDVAGDSHARACVLGGVGHEVQRSMETFCTKKTFRPCSLPVCQKMTVFFSPSTTSVAG